jgi:hypothetical protein
MHIHAFLLHLLKLARWLECSKVGVGVGKVFLDHDSNCPLRQIQKYFSHSILPRLQESARWVDGKYGATRVQFILDWAQNALWCNLIRNIVNRLGLGAMKVGVEVGASTRWVEFTWSLDKTKMHTIPIVRCLFVVQFIHSYRKRLKLTLTSDHHWVHGISQFLRGQFERVGCDVARYQWMQFKMYSEGRIRYRSMVQYRHWWRKRLKLTLTSDHDLADGIIHFVRAHLDSVGCSGARCQWTDFNSYMAEIHCQL